MAAVVIHDEEPDGLVRMIGGLVEANIDADPAKARLVESARGAAQIDVLDSGLTIGLRFVPGTLTIARGRVPGADVRIAVDSETLVGLATVPLRFGLPDVLTEDGRALASKMVTGGLRIGGLPRGLSMLRRLNRLLSVS